ncbi:hypothetical protein, partial [Paramuribaculum intestinale]|uniref:hypothetical protein n=1 Tax=Paramuribaculum intestinale TaxID=2094151 RepID=UPI00272F8AD8
MLVKGRSDRRIPTIIFLPKNFHNGRQESRTRVNKLHDEAFRRIAKEYGMDSDELQVFKGNSAPVENLMQQWNFRVKPKSRCIC